MTENYQANVLYTEECRSNSRLVFVEWLVWAQRASFHALLPKALWYSFAEQMLHFSTRDNPGFFFWFWISKGLLSGDSGIANRESHWSTGCPPRSFRNAIHRARTRSSRAEWPGSRAFGNWLDLKIRYLQKHRNRLLIRDISNVLDFLSSFLFVSFKKLKFKKLNFPNL